MKPYSIRRYVAWITLIPMVVIFSCIETYFLRSYFSELDRHIGERGELIATELASSSEYGVMSGNLAFLKGIAAETLRRKYVSAVVIMNSSHRIMSESGNLSAPAKGHLAGNPQALSRSGVFPCDDESLLIIQPIIPATVALDGFQSGISLKPIGLVAIQLNLKPTNRFKRSTLTYTICASLLFLALSGYLVHLASRRLTHPVKMLSDAVQAISQGKLDTRVSELEHVVEFNVLSHGINYMSERLRQDRSELQKQVDRATLNIRESMQKAEQANLEKSKFLAAASHDLRQPIHALGLFLGALSRTGLTETQKKLLENSCAASEATMKMLDTLLDFSRIEAGVVEPQWKTFRLQAILNKIENDLAPQADAKGIVYRTRETQLAVRSDPALVELILRNLVSNAIRYTEQGGLLVGCRKHGNQVVLEVWDTGIGIAKDQQEEVFREFHQLGNPERDRRKGLGLGLAIALGLARVLGHDLSLSSASGRGSVFRIALPKAILEMTPASPESPRIHVLSARVLVIDDDVTVLEGMRQLLCGWGCECDIAETIEDAIRLAGLNAPDMVISDYRLRGLRSGIQAIESLRHLLGEGLPALLITGDTAPERLREAQTSGLPLLHKPVMPAGLYYSIAKAIEVS